MLPRLLLPCILYEQVIPLLIGFLNYICYSCLFKETNTSLCIGINTRKRRVRGQDGGGGGGMMYHHACNDYPYSKRRDNFNVGVFIMKNERFIVAVGFFV